MIDRRDFLGSATSLALGGWADFETTTDDALSANSTLPSRTDDRAYRQYLEDLAYCDIMALGIPGRRSLIEEGAYPIAPDRVIVVDDAELRRFGSRHGALKKGFRRIERPWRERFPANPLLPSRKADLCVGLMDWLASHYRRPDLLERWANTLWRRELLGSTGMGHGLAFLHDFQIPSQKIRTSNGVADWWLVLLPGGLDWQAIDDQPVYYMLGPVMELGHPSSYLRVMAAMSDGLRPLRTMKGFHPARWTAELASVSTAAAARAVNFVVARGCARRAARS